MTFRELVARAPKKSPQSEIPKNKPEAPSKEKPRGAHRRIPLHAHKLSSADPHATRFSLLPISRS